MSDRINKPLALLAAAGCVAGAWGIVEALIEGTHATGLGSYTPWGLGVVVYLFFLGLSAGGLLLTLLTKVFGRTDLEPLSGLAVWLVIVTEVCAGIAIILDLGHWERSWRFVLSPDLGSPMFWMFLLFTALLLVYLLKARAMQKGDDAGAATMTWLSIPVGILFYGVNGFFFSILASHPVWNSSLVPVLFVVAALLSGGALLTFLAAVFGYGEAQVKALGRVVLLLLVIFAAIEWLHIAVGYMGGRPDVIRALDAMLGGKGLWAFWVVHTALGLALPLWLLARRDASVGGTAFACLLLALCFIGMRWGFVVSAQTVPALEGLPQAFQSARLTLDYCPSLGEWLVTLFVASLGLLGFVLGPRLAPGLFKEESHHA